MCNFVVPIRTCSKCHQREPLFHDAPLRDNEKAGSEEAISQSLVYMDIAQDCYSRWCIFSSEHPKTCRYCWLTCKQWHGKTREIPGGTPSYVCRHCEPRARRQSAWKPPRPAQPIDATRNVVVTNHRFSGLAQSLTR